MFFVLFKKIRKGANPVHYKIDFLTAFLSGIMTHNF